MLRDISLVEMCIAANVARYYNIVHPRRRRIRAETCAMINAVKYQKYHRTYIYTYVALHAVNYAARDQDVHCLRNNEAIRNI